MSIRDTSKKSIKIGQEMLVVNTLENVFRIDFRKLVPVCLICRHQSCRHTLCVHNQYAEIILEFHFRTKNARFFACFDPHWFENTCVYALCVFIHHECLSCKC